MLPDDALAHRIAALDGSSDVAAAGRVLGVVLARIATTLDPPVREALVEALPPAWRASAVAEGACEPMDAHPLDRLGAASGVAPGHAVELAHAAGRALAETLPADTLARLRAALGPPWSALLQRRPAPGSPPAARHRAIAPGDGHTLALGRPGSRRPLAEAAPAAAHAHSLAATAAPHADTRLSSGHAGGDPVDAPPPPRSRSLADADG